MSDVGLEVVRGVYRLMNIDPQWSDWFDRGFVWWGHRLAQYVWAEPCFEDEGITVARLHARTDLTAGVEGTDEQFAALGPILRRAALSGLARAPRGPERLQLACSVYVHEQTSAWLQRVL